MKKFAILKLLIFLILIGDAPHAAAMKLPLCEVFGRYVSIFKEAPTLAHHPWDFGKEWEQKIKAAWSDSNLSELDKNRQVFALLWEARLATANPVTRFLMRSVVRDATRQKSLYSRTLGRLLGKFMGPHYNPLANRVGMNVRQRSANDLLVLSHELGHAYHRNSTPFEFVAMLAAVPYEIQSLIIPAAVTPLMMYRIEGHAIGAQYEYARRIPKQVRERLIKDYRDKKRRFYHDPGDAQMLMNMELLGLTKSLEDAYFHNRRRTLERYGRFREALALGGDPSLKVMAANLRESLENKTGDAPEEDLQVARFLEEVANTGLRLRAKLRAIYPKIQLPPEELGKPGEIVGQRAEFMDLVLGVITRHRAEANTVALERGVANLFLESLRYAHLSKEEFIEKLRPTHGYDFDNLNRSWNSFGVFRYMALLSTMHAIIAWAQGYPDGIAGIPSYDVKFLLEMLQYFIGT